MKAARKIKKSERFALPQRAGGRPRLEPLEIRRLLSTNLLWSDEFNGAVGSQPSSAVWSYQTGGGGWGNGELENYTTSTANSSIIADPNATDGKALRITAIKDPTTGAITSARMNTQNKISFQYGYIEARLQIPFGQGMWPAFWMMGANNLGWPSNGEIDIMENIGKEPNIVHGTIHGPGYAGGAGPTGQKNVGVPLSAAYHTYGIQWAQDTISWYVDDIWYETRTNSPADIGAGHTWVYNQPFYFLLNLAVGGGWPGYPDATTTYPQYYNIDYIRVFLDVPAPTFTTQPVSQTVSVGDTVTFTAAASSSATLAYQWQSAPSGSSTFTSIPGANSTTLTLPAVQLTDNGTQYRLVASDSAGQSISSNIAVLTVNTNHTPVGTITITGGLTGGNWNAGTPITFSGTGTDVEDGTLSANRFTWKVDYLTGTSGPDADSDGLPGTTTSFISSISNTTASSFTPSITGSYKGADVAYVITLLLTDSGGRTATQRLIAYPNIVTMTLATSLAGLQVTLDGTSYSTPKSLNSVVGFQHSIGTATSQLYGGVTYYFRNWSDGGIATHTITTPVAGTTYTATYLAGGGFAAHVNFEPATAAVYSGYMVDSGLVYGDRGSGYTYGWSADNTAMTAERNNSNSTDKRYDTLCYMQWGGTFTWEIALPNGTYSVHIVGGDPTNIDSTERIAAEGVLVVSGSVTTARRWIEGTASITVNDGALTISSASGSTNNKINYIDITSANVPPTADIVDVTPDPRNTKVSSMTVSFSEPVSGFDLADLTLTRNSGANLLTASQTLTTTNNIDYTLSNLDGLTNLAGSYVLTLNATGSGIVDSQSAALATGASDAWTMNSNAVDVTSSGHAVYLRRNGSSAEIYAGTSSAGTLLSTWAVNSTLFFSGASALDGLIVDYSNGDPIGTGSVGFGGGGGALKIVGASSSDAFTVTAAGITHGSQTLSYSGVGAVTLQAGKFALTQDLGSVNAGVALNFGGNAVATLSANQTLGALNLTSNAIVTFAKGSATGVLRTASLALAATAKLDLATNDLILDYTGVAPLGTIEGLVAQGYGGGNWLGLGLTSSAAAVNPGLFALGVLDNAQATTPFDAFDGLNTAGHQQILVKFTWVDDLDLDGLCTANDAILFGNNYSSGTATHHQYGDINYSGAFDVNDAILFGNSYSAALPAISPAQVNSGAQSALAPAGMSRAAAAPAPAVVSSDGTTAAAPASYVAPAIIEASVSTANASDDSVGLVVARRTAARTIATYGSHRLEGLGPRKVRWTLRADELLKL